MRNPAAFSLASHHSFPRWWQRIQAWPHISKKRERIEDDLKLLFNKTSSLAAIATLLFAAAVCLSPVTLHAQTQQHAAAPQAQPMPHSFKGTVMALKNGQYALIMGRSPQGQPMGHFLDHTRKVKQYAGKQVKVTGNLNVKNNTVEVTSIQPR